MNKLLFLIIAILCCSFVSAQTLDAANVSVWNVPANFTFLSAFINASVDDIINITDQVIDMDSFNTSIPNGTITKSVTIHCTNTTFNFLNITASSYIKGCTVNGGKLFGLNNNSRFGIAVGAQAISLINMTVTNISALASTTGQDGSPAYGIFSSANTLFIDGITIKNISSGQALSSTPGSGAKFNGRPSGAAYGIFMSGTSLEIKNSNITNINGAQGGSGRCGFEGGAASGGDGGNAFGISMTNFSTVYNTTFTNINAGQGGSACATDADTGPGTLFSSEIGSTGAAAYSVFGTDNNVVIKNTISSTGGKAGNSAAFSIFGTGSCDDMGTAASGGFGYGVSLEDSNTIHNNSFNNIIGGVGASGGGCNRDSGTGMNGGIGGDSFGASINNHNSFINNTVIEITSSNGGAGGGGNGNGGIGGNTSNNYGIKTLLNSTITFNSFTNFTGSIGGAGGSVSCNGAGEHNGDSGSGQSIFTISVTTNSSVGAIITDNTIRNINGNDGKDGTTGCRVSEGGIGGDIFGISISGNASTLTHRNNNMSSFEGSIKGCDTDSGGSLDCTTNAEGFGSLYPVTEERVSEVFPQSAQTEFTGTNVTIQWYTAAAFNGTTTTPVVKEMDYQLFFRENTTDPFVAIDNATYTGNCNTIVCTFNWSFGSIKGKAFTQVNSTTVHDPKIPSNFTNTSSSPFFFIFAYDLILAMDNSPNPAHRTQELFCNYTVTSDKSYNATINVSWFKNGVLLSNLTNTTVNYGALVSADNNVNGSSFSVADNFTCSGTVSDGVTSTITNSTILISNFVPTDPLNLTCNSGTCPDTLADFTVAQCLDSTDNESDPISFFIGAFSPIMESLPNTTVVGKQLNIDFCNGINALEFIPDLSLFNFTSLTLTELNVTATNVTTCLYNASCTYNCPINVSVVVSATSSNHNMTCSGVTLNTSTQRIITNLNATSTVFNCTMDYLNASTGYDFNITFDVEV